MRHLPTALFASLALLSAVADETSNVDYGQATQSPTLDLVWGYELADFDGVTAAVVTSVRNNGADNPSGHLAVPTTVYDGSSGYIVKGIADGAFRDQIGLTSVSIPVTVETIGAGVFTGCTVLSEIAVDEGNPWFASTGGALYDRDRETIVACPARTETIVLPATLASIGEEAFANCHRLVSLSVPDSVTNIGDRAFIGCTRLGSITFEGDAPACNDTAFQDPKPTVYKSAGSSGWDAAPWSGLDVRDSESEQPSGVVSAESGRVTWRYRVVNGEAELYNNGSAAIQTATVETFHYDAETYTWVGDGRLVVPSSLGGYPVTRIGDGAFSGCAALSDVDIPSTIRKIGDRAFANCTGISAIDLPSGVQSIGYHPFAGSAIASLALPDSLRTLEGNPCAGCDTLLSITISGDNSYYAVVDGILYDKDVRTLVGCPARKESASVAQTVRTIGPEAFDGCFRLRALMLPDALATVGTGAFSGAIRLASLVFPASVSALQGEGLFEGCAALEFVGFAGNAPAVDPALFRGTSEDLLVFVAQGTTGWKDETTALPDSGKWPEGAFGRTIANLDVSAEAELKEGDVFTGITTNGTTSYAYTLRVLADRGVEILGVSPKPIGDFAVPSDFQSSLGTLTVKSLGDRLFANAIGLLSVEIPSSVVSIGDEVFTNCNVLASVTLNHGLRTIGRHPFVGTAIETIALPDTVSSIDGNVFYGCNPSVSLSVGDNNPYFAESAEGALYDKDFTTLFACPMLAESIAIPAATTGIAGEAFAGCLLLKSVFFDGDAPEAADGDALYADCHASLTSYVPYGIDSFGDVPGTWHLRPTLRSGEEPAEEGDVLTSSDGKWRYRLLDDGTAEIWNGGQCAYVASAPVGALQVPSTLDEHVVAAIGDGALANFAAVTSVSIPFSVTAIGENAFTNCALLAEFSVDASNLRFSTDGAVLFDYAKKEILAAGRAIENLSAPATVERIRAHAFDGCELLASATFGAALAEIGEGAFRGCAALAAVVYGGDAPAAADDVYDGTPEGLESVVEPDAAGWGDLPGTWRGRAIRARDAGEVHGDVYTDGTWYWVVQDGTAVIYNNGACALVNPNTSGAVQVPDEVTDKDTKETFVVSALGRRALYGCRFVNGVTLPDTIDSIGEEAFSGTRISTLRIPAYVEFLYGNPAAGCAHFAAFTVDEENMDFAADENGLLYDFFGEELVGVPATATTVTIPASVAFVRADAFAGCSRLLDATYLCDAPGLGSDGIYADTKAAFTTFAAAGTTGWDGTSTTNMPASGLWPAADADGRPIVSLYRPDGSEPAGDIFTETDANGLTWHYRVVDGVAEIYRNGETAVTSDAPILAATLPATLGGYVVKGLGAGSLAGLRGITSVSIPATYEWIGDFAFSNCTSLASANLGGGVEEIGRWPFFGTKITRLEIPDSVSAIDGNPVAGAPLARNVSVSENQPHFSVADGVLYDKGRTTMLACPAAKETAALPATMTSIADDALYGCHVALGGETDDGDVVWQYAIVGGTAVVTGAQGSAASVAVPGSLGGAPVSKVEPSALAALSGVRSFASLGAAYTARNGCLYSANGTHLVRVPDALVLPYAVVSLSKVERFDITIVPGVANEPGASVDRTTVTTNAYTSSGGNATTNNVAGDISLDALLANVVVIDDFAFAGCNLFEDSSTSTTNAAAGGEGAFLTPDGVAGVRTVFTVTTSSITHATEIRLPASVLKVCDDALSGSGVTIAGEIPSVRADALPYEMDIPSYSADAAIAQAVEILPLASPAPSVVGDADYRAYFRIAASEKPGAPGTYTVTAELDEAAIGFAATQLDVAASVPDVAAGLADEATLSVRPGLWYAIASSSAVDGPFGIVDCRFSSGTTLTLTMTRPSAQAGYYKVLVDVAEISACP